jgi:hypothetical protein
MEKILRKIVNVNGDTLVIPELKKFQGRKIEIIFREFSERKSSKKNLSEYSGSLRFAGDALEYQEKMRAEWEEREKSF